VQQCQLCCCAELHGEPRPVGRGETVMIDDTLMAYTSTAPKCCVAAMQAQCRSSVWDAPLRWASVTHGDGSNFLPYSLCHHVISTIRSGRSISHLCCTSRGYSSIAAIQPLSCFAQPIRPRHIRSETWRYWEQLCRDDCACRAVWKVFGCLQFPLLSLASHETGLCIFATN
jgi:hypothetical protein